MPDTDDTYTVPLIDCDTGDGWSVEVQAESPMAAAQQARDESDCDGVVAVAHPYHEKHLDVDLDTV